MPVSVVQKLPCKIAGAFVLDKGSGVRARWKGIPPIQASPGGSGVLMPEKRTGSIIANENETIKTYLGTQLCLGAGQ